MENCWLSPKGEVYYCEIHTTGAENIVNKLNLTEEFYACMDAGRCYEKETFLELRGWIKYCKYPWSGHSGWVILSTLKLTQAQIDKIYELTGELVDDGYLI